jgi:NitT/TauT family transport system permease protein
MSETETVSVPMHGLKVAAVLIGSLLLWQAAVVFAKIPSYLLPSPIAIVEELIDDPIWYLKNSAETLIPTLAGFALALVVGCAAAIGVIYSRVLESTIYTFLVTLNSVPKIALAPVFIIWLGTGMSSKVAIAFMIALFAIVVDAVLGLRSVDADALDLFRAMRGTRFQTLVRLRMPAALPHLFAGMKLSISLALIGAVAAEFVASEGGLGHIILQAQGMFQTTRVFAAIAMLGVMGTALFYIVDFVERIACPWHISHRSKTRASTDGG